MIIAYLGFKIIYHNLQAPLEQDPFITDPLNSRVCREECQVTQGGFIGPEVVPRALCTVEMWNSQSDMV